MEITPTQKLAPMLMWYIARQQPENERDNDKTNAIEENLMTVGSARLHHSLVGRAGSSLLLSAAVLANA